MLKISSWFGKSKPQVRLDAENIYAKLMKQSRAPWFFTNIGVRDDFDGRMEVLALHVGIVMQELGKRDKNAQKLSQILYDVMVDDFDIALREEGLSDTGVSRRIKPMAKFVLSRAKHYARALSSTKKDTKLIELTSKFIDDKQGDAQAILANYAHDFSNSLAKKSLGQLAKADFNFPKFI